MRLEAHDNLEDVVQAIEEADPTPILTLEEFQEMEKELFKVDEKKKSQTTMIEEDDEEEDKDSDDLRREEEERYAQEKARRADENYNRQLAKKQREKSSKRVKDLMDKGQKPKQNLIDDFDKQSVRRGTKEDTNLDDFRYIKKTKKPVESEIPSLKPINTQQLYTSTYDEIPYTKEVAEIIFDELDGPDRNVDMHIPDPILAETEMEKIGNLSKGKLKKENQKRINDSLKRVIPPALKKLKGIPKHDNVTVVVTDRHGGTYDLSSLDIPFSKFCNLRRDAIEEVLPDNEDFIRLGIAGHLGDGDRATRKNSKSNLLKSIGDDIVINVFTMATHMFAPKAYNIMEFFHKVFTEKFHLGYGKTTMRYLGNSSNFPENQNLILLENVSMILEHYSTMFPQDSFMRYCLTTVENRVEAEKFMSLAFGYFRKSKLNEASFLASVNLMNANPVVNIINFIADTTKNNWWPNDMVVRISNRCLVQSRNVDVILFVFVMIILLIKDIQLKEIIDTEEVPFKKTTFSDFLANNVIDENIFVRSLRAIVNAYDKVFRLYPEAEASILEGASTRFEVYERIKKGNLCIRSEMEEGMEILSNLTQFERTTWNAKLKGYWLNNGGNLFNEKHALKKMLTSVKNKTERESIKSQYLIHESESLGLIIRSPAIPLGLSQFFRRERLGVHVFQNFKVDTLISFLTEFITRVGKKLNEEYFIYSIGISAVGSTIFKKDYQDMETLGFPDVNCVSILGTSELFSSPTNWDTLDENFLNDRTFRDYVGQHFDSPTFFPTMLKNYFTFLYDYIKEIDTSRMGIQADAMNDGSVCFISSKTASRDRQAAQERVNILRTRVDELARRAYNMRVSVENSTEVQRLRCLGCLYNLDSIGSNYQGSFYDGMAEVGSGFYGDFLMNMNTIFAWFLKKKAPETKDYVVYDEKINNDINEEIMKYSCCLADIPYYLISFNLTLLPPTALRTLNTLWMKSWDIKKTKENARLPAFFKRFNYFIKERQRKGLRLEDYWKKSFTFRINEEIKRRPSPFPREPSDPNDPDEGAVDHYQIMEIKKNMVQEEPKSRLLNLLMNCKLYTSNTRYIKSIDWIDSSNSRISYIEKYFVDTEFFNTVDIPCQFKCGWFTYMFYVTKTTSVKTLYKKLWDEMILSQELESDVYCRDQFYLDPQRYNDLKDTKMVLSDFARRKELIDIFYDDCENSGLDLDSNHESYFMREENRYLSYALQSRNHEEDRSKRTNRKLFNMEQMIQLTFKKSKQLLDNPEEAASTTSTVDLLLSVFHKEHTEDLYFFINWLCSFIPPKAHHKIIVILHEVNQIITVKTEDRGDDVFIEYKIVDYDEFFETNFACFFPAVQSPFARFNLYASDPYLDEETYLSNEAQGLPLRDLNQLKLSYRWCCYCFSVKANHISIVDFKDILNEYNDHTRNIKYMLGQREGGKYTLSIIGYKAGDDHDQKQSKNYKVLTERLDEIDAQSSDDPHFNRYYRDVQTAINESVIFGLNEFDIFRKQMSLCFNDLLIFWDIESYSGENGRQVPIILGMQIYSGNNFNYFFNDLMIPDNVGSEEKTKFTRLLQSSLLFSHSFVGGNCVTDFISFIYYSFLQKSSGKLGQINLYAFNGAKFDHIFLIKPLVQYGLQINGSGINDPKSLAAGHYQSSHYNSAKSKYSNNTILFIDFMLIQNIAVSTSDPNDPQKGVASRALGKQCSVFLKGENELQKLTDVNVANTTESSYSDQTFLKKAIVYCQRDCLALAGLYLFFRTSVMTVARQLQKLQADKIKHMMYNESMQAPDHIARFSLKLKNTYILGGDNTKIPPYVVTSSAGLAMKIYKDYFHSTLIDLEGDSMDVLPAIRDTYYGGFTSNFVLYKPLPPPEDPENILYYYDINSSYPYIMTKEMPIKKFSSTVHAFEHRNVINSSCHHFWVNKPLYMSVIDKFSLYHVVHLSMSPNEQEIYPFPIKGKMKNTKRVGSLYPKELKDRWFWGYELLRVANIHNSFRHNGIAPYEICDIDKYLLYPESKRHLLSRDALKDREEEGAIFRNYVEYFYEKKANAKAPGASPQEKALEGMYKLLLNSLYGKFGQRHFNKSYYGFNFDLHAQSNPDIVKSYHKYGFREERGVIRKLEVENNERGVGDLVRIASYITAVARIRLWKVMMYIMYGGSTHPDEIMKRLIYYCDTDSIITNLRLPSRFIDPSKLGKWKLEKTSKCGSFILPKFYSLYDDDIAIMDIKSKGITKNNMKWQDWFKLLESREFQTKQVQFSRYMGGVYVNPDYQKTVKVSIQKRKYVSDSLYETKPSKSFKDEEEYNEYLNTFF